VSRRGEHERRSQGGEKETEVSAFSGHQMRDEPAARLDYLIAPKGLAADPSVEGIP
jgi:hypothetical protein